MKSRLGLTLLCFMLLVSGCVSPQQNTISDADAVRIARDYVNVYTLNDLTFAAINGTGDIPYEAGDKINPANYSGVVAPPSVRHLDDGSVVTLYSWSEKNGYLARWDLTVRDGKVVFERGEYLAMLVGHCAIVPEGYLPSLGVFTNESVSG